MITDSLLDDRGAFEARTGWAIKPEGACKGALCIPLTSPAEGEMLNLASLAEQLNMPLVHDVDHGIWALGPESIGSRALSTAEAPNLTLPDLDGNTFELASLRGQKVLLLAWAPY